MKKFIFSIVAMAALASCAKEETISRTENAPIAFETPFVENATRATDVNKDNLNNFRVFAAVSKDNNTGMILNNEPVKKFGNGYVYSHTQYWVPGAAYDFVAIANDNPYWSYTTTDAKNGTISFDNSQAAANNDLVFASASRAVRSGFDNYAADTQPVAFTFNHLLSRVRFTFINGIVASSNLTFKISNVTITDAYKKGTLAVTEGATATAWSTEDKTLNIPFAINGTIVEGIPNVNGTNGAAKFVTSEHHYLIPANAGVTVTFDLTIYQSGVELGTYARKATIALNAAKGASYDIKATLNTDNVLPTALKPIVFTVEDVTAWADYTGQDSTVSNI